MSDIPTMGQPKWVAGYVEKLERELAAAQDRMVRLENAIIRADMYIDALQDHDGVEYTTWVCNVADARNAYRVAKYEAKEAKWPPTNTNLSCRSRRSGRRASTAGVRLSQRCVKFAVEAANAGATNVTIPA